MSRVCAILCAFLYATGSMYGASQAPDETALIQKIQGFMFSPIEHDQNYDTLTALNLGVHNELLNIPDAKYDTLLHKAVRAGDEWSVTWLLSRGAWVNLPNWAGDIPLHLSMDEKITKLLLKHGADPDALNRMGNTPYNAGAESRVLLARAMQKTLNDFCTQIPTLQQLCIYGLLKRKQDTTSLPAEVQMEIATAQRWLDAKLHTHLLVSKPEQIELLLQRGANPNRMSFSQGPRVTPLLSAVKAYFAVSITDQDVEVKRAGYMKIIDMLLTAGASPHLQSGGTSALCHCINKGMNFLYLPFPFGNAAFAGDYEQLATRLIQFARMQDINFHLVAQDSYGRTMSDVLHSEICNYNLDMFKWSYVHELKIKFRALWQRAGLVE